MLDAAYFTPLACLIAFGAFAHGFMGLGFGIIVMAGLAFTSMDLERASTILSLVLPVLFLTIICSGRHGFRLNIGWRLAWVLFAGAFLGVPLGYWFLHVYGAHSVFKLALGLTLVGFSLNYLLRPRIRTRLHPGVGLLAGLAGGFLAGAFTAGGPPIALFLYTQMDDVSEAKAALQLIFLSATWWRLLNIHFLGPGFSVQIFNWALVLALVVALFAWLGQKAARRISPTVFTKIVYCFIGLAGLINVVKFFI
jgi:uncharacterized protein